MTPQEPLSASQARLQDDLLGLVKGDVRCDDVVRQLYSSDGSPFEETPSAVVWPRTTQDVAAVVQYAQEKGLSVHPRGAGTSASAAAIGSGIILDFSRYMRRVLQAGDDFVRVQPGAVRERVNDQLRRTRRAFFAPNSGHVPTGSIGGALAVDNIGPRWLRYGSPHESVLELKVVLADGSIHSIRPFHSIPSATRPDAPTLERRRFLNAALADAADSDDAFAAELAAAAERRDLEFGYDFNDGYGCRSFQSDFVRDEYFLRTFGASSRELREFLRVKPWLSALREIRRVEQFLDAEQRTTRPCRCGFALRDVLRGGFDPTRFFTGSEGSLGIIVEASLATVRLPAASGATILLFDSLDRAVRAVPHVLRFEPTLCDLLDSRVVTLTRDWDARFEEAFPQGSEGALVVELDAASEAELRERMNELQHVVREELGSFGRWIAYTPEDRKLFRDLLRKSSCARLRVSPSFQPFPFWDDVQTPVEAIPDFLHDVQALLKRGKLVYSVSGHVGNGQISIQPILPYSAEEERQALALSDKFEELVLKYHGEIGSARGNGRVRTAAFPKRFPNLSSAFVAVKNVFDPKNLLNPDCVVSPALRRFAVEAHDSNVSGIAAPSFTRATAITSGELDEEDSILAPEADAALRESSLHSRSIHRRVPFVNENEQESELHDDKRRLSYARQQLEYQLVWRPELVNAPARQCNGCGHCRIRTPETRLCPAFRHAPEEDSSCRAKANLIRGALDGTLPLETLTLDAALNLGQRCLRCHCCSTECPAQVDAARLAFRIRSANVAAKGLSFSELCSTRVDLTLDVAAFFAPLVNLGLRTWFGRRIFERLFGLAQPRRIPKIIPWNHIRAFETQRRAREEERDAAQNFLSAPRIQRVKRKATLVVDTYERHFDLKLIQATISVLERNNTDVKLLEKPRSSGSTAFAIGDVDRAELFATRNVATLREAMRDGSTLVAVEPSTAACVVKDYPYFCNDADAHDVYANITDVCGYLARLNASGEFNRADLKRIRGASRVGYHAPCAALALSGAALPSPTYAQKLLAMIPELSVKRIERGCCGFACFSGFTKRRYTESLRLGSRLFLSARRPELDFCVSECSFCNLQLSQALASRAAAAIKNKGDASHVVKLLAASYGAMPLEEAILETLAPVPTKGKYPQKE